MMRSSIGIVSLAVIALVTIDAVPAGAADVTWVSDASGNWGTAANWSSDPDLPGATDRVTIDRSSVVTVTIDEGIKFGTYVDAGGLFCENDLTVTGDPTKSLRLTIGYLGGWINGTLTLQNNRELLVNQGVFSVNGPANVNSGCFSAINAGELNLPGLTAFTGGVKLNVQAGGKINALALANIDGATLDAATGGTIRIANGIATLSDGRITLRDGGQLLNADGNDALPAFLSMTNSRVSVDDSVAGFDNLASFSGSRAGVSNGGSLILPALTTWTLVSPSSMNRDLSASGSGSLVEANSALTLDAADTSWRMWLDASDGGRVEMQNATVSSSAAGGQIMAEASGSDSVLDIRSTKNLSPSGLGSRMELDVSDNGKIIISDQVTEITDGVITMASGGTIEDSSGGNALAQLTAVTNSSIELDGVSPGFDNLTDVSGSSLCAQNGSQVTLAPSADPYQIGGAYNDEADICAGGAGTVIDLSTLTDIQSDGFDWLGLCAADGGRIIMPNATVNSATGGWFAASAYGADAVVDIRSLENPTLGGLGSQMYLGVGDGGKIIISDQVTAITEGEISLSPGGTIENSLGNNAIEEFTAVTNSEIYLWEGASAAFNNLTEISGSSIELQDGGTFTLAPSAGPFQLGGDFYYGAYWDAYGEGTVLDLSTLPSFQSNGTEWYDHYIEATDGGVIDLSGVTQLADGVYYEIMSFGTDCVINLSSLSYTGDQFSFIEASAGGKIVMNLTDFDNIQLCVDEGSAIEMSDGSDTLSQITRFTNGALCISDGRSLTLPDCVDVSGSDLYAVSGSSITLGPSVTDFAMGGDYCTYADWFADNRSGVAGGGVLDFSSLQTISATEPWQLDIELIAGGKLDLSNIESMPADGYLNVRVEDHDSLLDLSSFEGLGGANTTADFRVYDFGTVQFNATGSTDLAGITLDVGPTGQVLGGEFGLGTGAELTGNGLISADVTNSAGTVSPGESPGILTIEGDYAQGADGTLLIDIAGPTPGDTEGYDVLRITGDAALDGTLSIVKSDSFDIGGGMEFLILELTGSGTLSGTFAGLAEGAEAWTGADNTLFISYAGGNGNDVMLFTLVPEPATIAMLASGALCLTLLVWRRRSG